MASMLPCQPLAVAETHCRLQFLGVLAAQGEHVCTSVLVASQVPLVCLWGVWARVLSASKLSLVCIGMVRGLVLVCKWCCELSGA
jgi:hypothetical protein